MTVAKSHYLAFISHVHIEEFIFCCAPNQRLTDVVGQT